MYMGTALRILSRFSVLASAIAVTGQAQAACLSGEQRLAEIVNRAKTSDTLVLAHRGYWGKYSGNPTLPENSFGAIEKAADECMDGAELDVKMTKDGIPVLMHDFNLGRTTTVDNLLRQPRFDPITGRGANPKVSDLYAQQIDKLKLLTPDRRLETGFGVPRLAEVLDRWKLRGMRIPLVFDVKTANAVRAVNALVASKGVGGSSTMAVKVNATLYPDPAGFYHDALSVNVIPVYTTNMLGNISVATSLAKWMSAVGTIEVNVKQKDGLLYLQKQQALRAGKRVGVFHTLPDGPIAGQFYKNTGVCCYRLSDLFYRHRVMGQPAGEDTADRRGELNFLVPEGFGLITSDDPNGTVRFLAKAGKRNAHYQNY